MNNPNNIKTPAQTRVRIDGEKNILNTNAKVSKNANKPAFVKLFAFCMQKGILFIIRLSILYASNKRPIIRIPHKMMNAVI